MTTSTKPRQDENIGSTHVARAKHDHLEITNPTRLVGHLGRRWAFLACLFVTAISLSVSLHAQTFQAVPALSFTKAYTGANPLPQVISIASTGANFSFTVTATSTTGGSWLTISATSGCCYATPQAITVTANPSVTLAAGTYTGLIAVKSSTGTVTLNIPVSLTIKAADTSFFDDLTGALTFSMQTGGIPPPVQTFEIRNAGTGTLSWTASSTTADGGAWLSLSAASGTAPFYLSVGINPAELPGLGLTAGTFTGQVVLKTSEDSVTVPVIVTVGSSVFRQINPLNFTKEYAGGDPLSQVITLASTGTNLSFYVSVASSTGGTWLAISNTSGCCYSTPNAITVTVAPAITLAAGIYSAEIIAKSSTGAESVVVPVTLTIESNTAFFDSTPGEFAFSMATNGTAPPAQALQIRNAGPGTLSWTLRGSTSDGGAWLTASATSGTAPSTINIGIVPADLPGKGLVAGTFTGQIILQSTQDRVTIPVSVTVGQSVFRQINPLNFIKLYRGANPLPQVITIASTGTNFSYYVSTVNSTGGSWLAIDHTTGCCYSTPDTITVLVAPDINLAVGTYSAEIVAKSSTGAESIAVPVTLTIEPSTTSFFDSLPGDLTFSMLTGGTAPPVQTFQIRNAGAGTLAWAASTTTADGAAWLTLSPASGTAPSFLSVGINPANLPGAGLTSGTFVGQVILRSGGNQVTIPVVVNVGAAVFRQINPLNFTKTYAGANPLPQVITVASTGTDFAYYVNTASATGGNWLTINHTNGCCYSTPDAITVTANPAVTLAAGTYSAEIIVSSSTRTQTTVVPVTLTVEPSSATYFDSLPGEVTFSMAAGGSAPASQAFQIRNGGAGTLNWSMGASTSDGLHWLSVSPTSGTAPSMLTVAVVPANLPGKGLVVGTFTGQVILQTGTDRVTIPVVVKIGPAVFSQLKLVAFTKSYGGANPAAQSITIASTGANISYSIVAATSTGGSWLALSQGTGCCYSTPASVTLTANPAVSLAAGVYTAEIIVRSSNGAESMLIPVVLTIDTTTKTATPVFTPAGGTYSSPQSVTITDATHDAAIYYTTDGSTPTTSSKVYSVPIAVNATETIKAISIAPGFQQSAIGTAVYTLTMPVAATPKVTQTITITEATPGATVYYTTNGTTPTTSSAKYTGPITLSSSGVLKFIAVAPNYSQSAVRTVTDTVQ
jgi:hypothetical protein